MNFVKRLVMIQEYKLSINGFDLELTCGACPEQYDVFLQGKQVGYLRLRHGNFTARYPECGGELVYQATPDGDGVFEDDERERYLTEAIDAIAQRCGEQIALNKISEMEDY